VLREIGPKAARVTDKMPFNFLWAGLVHLALPRATIIHCRRTAIDTAPGQDGKGSGGSKAFPTGGAELVAYFRSYRRLTDHWRRVLPADRLIEVDYEDLTRAPEPVIRRIIAGCGLKWDDACLHPEHNPRAVEDAEQVANPAADLSQLRRALATLRTVARPAQRAPRRPSGIRRRRPRAHAGRQHPRLNRREKRRRGLRQL
jgi:hypothetical protein